MNLRKTYLYAITAIALSFAITACQGHAPQGETHAEEATGQHHMEGHEGHGDHAKEPHAGPTTNPADVLPNDGTRQVGDITRCPVTDDVFTVEASTKTTTHDGKTYYLCCDGCEKKFQADPVSFLSKAPKSEPTTNAADVLPNDGTRKVGDITRCPVSGDTFKISSDSTKTAHKGGTVYFCCGGCVDKFKADPDSFTSH